MPAEIAVNSGRRCGRSKNQAGRRGLTVEPPPCGAGHIGAGSLVIRKAAESGNLDGISPDHWGGIHTKRLPP